MKDIVPISDEVLVKKAQGGDYPSFEELVKRHEKKIYNLAYRLTGNQEDANDVLQETLLQAFRKLSGFKGNSKLSTWLYRIALNTSLMKKRKEKKMETVSLDMPVLTRKGNRIKRELSDDWSKNPLTTLENKEVREILSKAISSLPEEYRTILILRGFNGLSNEEAAKMLNISLPAVKSRLHRARLLLRNALSQYFKEGTWHNGFGKAS